MPNVRAVENNKMKAEKYNLIKQISQKNENLNKNRAYYTVNAVVIEFWISY